MKIIARSSYLILLIALVFGSFITFNKAQAQPISCLPSCDVTDGLFFTFIAKDQPNGVSNQNMNFGITSPANAESVEIGIFDGDNGADWDIAGVELLFTLFADPEGDGTGTIAVEQWTSADMINNDWFNATIPNFPNALSEDGTYKYNLLIVITSQAGNGRNSIKVRTTDGLLIAFALQMFSFNLVLSEPSDFFTVFPDLDIEDPNCFTMDPQLPPLSFCDPRDPSCCLSNSTYTGTWQFYFEAPPDLNRLKLWDGDFDFGGSILNGMGGCIVDGVNVDTNDENTGPIVPNFAASTESVPQGISTPTSPQDDECFGFAPRSPSVVYDLVDPNGIVHTNVNPSGNQEWELFSITTVPPLNPMIDDLLVADIPEGIWSVRTRGLDVFNVNLFFFDFPILGVDETGDPTELPDPPAPIPTLSEWGLIALASILLVMSVYYLRRKRAFS